MIDLLGDLAAEHASLDAVVGTLDQRGWATPTPAEGWNVKDCVIHLAYFDEQAALAATDSDAFAETAAAFVSQIEESGLDTHLDRGRGLPGADVLAWWRSSRADMLAAFAGQDPSERMLWYGPPMSARSFLTARLMETWAHGRDVADGLGVRIEPTDRLRHVAHLGVITRGWSYLVRGQAPSQEGVEVRLTGPSGAEWRWNEGADQSVSGPAEDFCLVVTQRINVADTELIIDGEAAAEWMAIAQAFAGEPGPGRPPSTR